MNSAELNIIHVSEIVKIHKLAFKNFFLTHLGDKFLYLYYRTVISSSMSISYGVFDDSNNLLGFGVATKKSRGFHKKIVLDNLYSYVKYIVLYLITNPCKLVRLYKNLSKRDSKINDKGNYAELLSIAVDPSIQESGLGRNILELIERDLIKYGIKTLTLTTDEENNDSVIKFYNNMGYSLLYKFISYPKRKMNKLKKTLIK